MAGVLWNTPQVSCNLNIGTAARIPDCRFQYSALATIFYAKEQIFDCNETRIIGNGICRGDQSRERGPAVRVRRIVGHTDLTAKHRAEHRDVRIAAVHHNGPQSHSPWGFDDDCV